MSLLVLGLASCEQQVAVREYEEMTITSPLEHHMGPHGDTHALMENAPFMGVDHPDISGVLPEGHPDISGSLPMAGTAIDPQTQKALDASVAKAPLAWKTPEGWNEEPGGGMRVASFHAQDGAGGIECSIVSLGGQAGGFQPNVIRWMKQINMDVPPQDQLEKFLSMQETLRTEGGFDITVIDLTDFSGAETSPSMIASIAELPDLTIFVKMTGVKTSLLENKDKFKSLCQSLKVK
jgi:hypothetical protein